MYNNNREINDNTEQQQLEFVNQINKSYNRYSKDHINERLIEEVKIKYNIRILTLNPQGFSPEINEKIKIIS